MGSLESNQSGPNQSEPNQSKPEAPPSPESLNEPLSIREQLTRFSQETVPKIPVFRPLIWNEATGKMEPMTDEDIKAEHEKNFTSIYSILREIIGSGEEELRMKNPKYTNVYKLNNLLNQMFGLGAKFQSLLKEMEKYAYEFEGYVSVIEEYKSQITEYLDRVSMCKEGIDEYYRRALDSARNDLQTGDSGNFSMEFYDDLLHKIWVLYNFQSSEIKDKTECWNLFLECQMKTREFIANNPSVVDEFIDKKVESFMSIRSVSYSDFLDQDIVDRLLSANSSLIQVDKQEKGFSCQVNWNGDFWNLKRLQLPGGELTITVFSEKNPDIFVNVSLSELIDLLSVEDGKDFGIIVDRAFFNYDNELAGRETLGSFDLPDSERIGWINLFPKDYDYVIAGDLQSSFILEKSLASRYSGFEGGTPVFTDDPETDSISRITELYSSGMRNFYFNISNHGTPDGIQFKNPITADFFVKLVERFPDIKIFVGSIACFGGGLRDGLLKSFEKNPELRTKIFIFLQSKPDLINVAGISASLADFGINPGNVTANDMRDIAATGSKFSIDSYSTYTSLFFLKSFREGNSYGNAFIDADKESKGIYYGDPESIIGGKLITDSGLRNRGIAES